MSLVDRKKTRAAARAYLAYLYTPEAQDIIARNHPRPTDAAVTATRPVSRKSRCRRSRISAAGIRLTPTLSPTAHCSTASIGRVERHNV